MHNWLGVTLTFVVLSATVVVGAAQIPPVPDNPLRAQTSLGFNANTRCPALRIDDEGTIAVVVFWVPRIGAPSQISIKSSSGSKALDAAAISCVSKLRFAAASRIGDGELMDSWQQIAFRWAIEGTADETRTMTSQNAVPAAIRASEPTAQAPAPMAVNAWQQDSGDQAKSVTVHVCVDETGRLKQDPTIVHSSGMASLDQAAVKIAASGSSYYRPDTASNGSPVSGCAQLEIRFEAK
jgi:TonB family protein